VEEEAGNPIVRQVGPGCTCFIPESRYHSTLNTGSAPMQLFVVYSPAGPERTLRELPDFRLIPAGA
ncbi:MAG: cupin, partial [Proteobacteria bacterium]